ncbi:MAG: YlxR family protein [Chloroflexi bacterium]|nr:YlxR family protein [Chloroflexota bacterium]
MARGPRPKHVPIRTCIACRQTDGKRELVRVVRVAAEAAGTAVKIDPTGKLAGRGAYICRNRSCWEQALTGRRLAAALKTTLTDEELAALHAYAANLPEHN